MSLLELQPGNAMAEITAAYGAATTVGAASPSTIVGGPISTGALSISDAAAGLLEGIMASHESTQAEAALARANALGGAAATSVVEQTAINEENAQNLTAVGTGA